MSAETTLDFAKGLKKEIAEKSKENRMTDDALKRALTIFSELNPEFIFDKDNIKEVIALLHYFAGINYTLDITKGLCISGNVGVGKTYMLNAFNKYAKKIRSGMAFRSTSVSTLILKQDREVLFTDDNLFVDELGIEKDYTIIVYGTPASDYIDLVFMELYSAKFIKGKQVHITSNFDQEETKKQYNIRLKSRFDEMFEQITLKGISWRGNSPRKKESK